VSQRIPTLRTAKRLQKSGGFRADFSQQRF
jgi:hypothetical protein